MMRLSSFRQWPKPYRVLLGCIGYTLLVTWGAYVADEFVGDAGFAPWYPPAGLMMGMLLVAGPRYIPLAIFARVFSISVLFPEVPQDDLDGLIVRAVTISCAYGAAAWVVRMHYQNAPPLRRFALFAGIGATGAPIIGALAVGLIEVALSGGSVSDSIDAARTFWVGDAVAIASISPFFFYASARLRQWPRLELAVRSPQTPRQRIEIVVQVIILVVVPVAAIAASDARGIGPLIGIGIVPVAWCVVRHDDFWSSAGIFVVETSVALAAVEILGAGADLQSLQVSMLAAALASLFVIALLRESDRHYRARLAQESHMAQIMRLDSLGRLSGAIAHDFANVLTVIEANVQLTRETLTPGSLQAESLDDALAAVRSGRGLARELMSFAKDGEGAPAAAVSVRDILQRMEPVLRTVARTNGSDLSLTTGDSALIILADVVSIEQVILNLVTNAADAMNGGGRIEVHAERRPREEDDGDSVIVSVRDTGPGIPVEIQSRIFEPFFTTKGEKGTGLGLATAHAVVTRLGGTIEIESLPGNGATLRVRLPAATA